MIDDFKPANKKAEEVAEKLKKGRKKMEEIKEELNETSSNYRPTVRGYKIINPDWTCRGKQYSCPGEFEENIAPELCEKGMHFCLKLSDCFMYYQENDNNHYVEVEAYGDVRYGSYNNRNFSGGSKCCTNKLRIVKELSIEEVINILREEEEEENSNYKPWANFGQGNLGAFNYGSYNKGDNNEGVDNAGNGNNGNGNEGHDNKGHFNKGSLNSGVHNVGEGNIGNCCLGFYNSGDFSIGALCSYPSKINLFNKPSDWTIEDFYNSDARKVLQHIYQIAYYDYKANIADSEYCEIIEKYVYRGASHTRTRVKINDITKYRQKYWGLLSEEEKQEVLNLPNFDADIFKECTGIDVNTEVC